MDRKYAGFRKESGVFLYKKDPTCIPLTSVACGVSYPSFLLVSEMGFVLTLGFLVRRFVILN